MPLFLSFSLYNLLLVFLSPLPWQFRTNRSQLNAWFWAVPASLVLCSLLGAVLLRGGPYLANASLYFIAQGPYFILATWMVFLPMGWLQAYAAWVKEHAEQASAKAHSSTWMRHSAPFDPKLLARHLQHLAQKAEAVPRATVDGILILAQLYRKWLSMTEKSLVSLEEERQLLELFCEAEQFRAGSDLNIEWDWSPGPVTWKLPPFSLFSITAQMIAADTRSLALGARYQQGKLILFVRGKLPPDFSEQPAWHEVSMKLSQTFGNKSTLAIDASGGVTLTLPGMAP